jgi:hypothetical protein
MNLQDSIKRILDKYGNEKAPTGIRNRELFKCILASESVDTRDSFITSNMRLVAAATMKFIKRHPRSRYLMDDMFANGLYKFTVGVDTLIKRGRQDSEEFWSTIGRDDGDGNFHVMTYLYITAYRGVQDMYERDAIKAISPAARERFTPESRDKPITKIDVSDFMLEGSFMDGGWALQVLDEILNVCKTDLQRAIINLRITKTDEEIAQLLGIAESKVARIRQQIDTRYQQTILCELLND